MLGEPTTKVMGQTFFSLHLKQQVEEGGEGSNEVQQDSTYWSND